MTLRERQRLIELQKDAALAVLEWAEGTIPIRAPDGRPMVLAVDGRPVASLVLDALRVLLAERPGGTVTPAVATIGDPPERYIP